MRSAARRARGSTGAKRQLRAPQAAVGGLEVVTVRGVDVHAAIATLQADPAVHFAEPNWLLTRPPVVPEATSTDPSDRGYIDGSHWGLYGESTSPSNVYGSQAGEAWAKGITGSKAVYVGVIDEGIQYTHCDLAQNIWTNPGESGTYTILSPNGTTVTRNRADDGVDDDRNGYADDVHGWDFFHNDKTIYDTGEDHHGTHVSGTIGSAANNTCDGKLNLGDGGDIGVNWDVTLISGKFLGPGGGSLDAAVRAVDYMTYLKAGCAAFPKGICPQVDMDRVGPGLNIVALNNSWGGGAYSQALHDAIIRAAKVDILFIAAAGNDGRNIDGRLSYPSAYNTLQGTSTEQWPSWLVPYDSVIAVAAIDSTGRRASFSNYGATTVDLGAPGVGIWSAVPGGYAPMSGTSMATPHVTGAAALYAAVNPTAKGAQIRKALLDTATRRATPSLTRKTVTGGRLDISCLQTPSNGPLGDCK